MARLRNTKTGVLVDVSDATAARLGPEYRPEAPRTGAEPAGSYASMTVAELRGEIGRRNAGREEADLLPSDGKKADLVAALEADDGD